MLYDPKWQKPTETKEDVFDLSTLIAWLAKQEPDETYCYLDHGRCLLGQYLTEKGFKKVRIYSCGRYCAKIAENPIFIQARDTEWDEGVNYAKKIIAAAIRAQSGHG